MENPEEDEIRKRWENEAKEQEDRVSARPRKRPRQLEYANGNMNTSNVRLLKNINSAPDDMSSLQFRDTTEAGSSNSKTKSKRPGGRAVATRAAASRAQGRVTEVLDEEDIDDIVELG